MANGEGPEGGAIAIHLALRWGDARATQRESLMGTGKVFDPKVSDLDELE
jgi:hypothetical protein